MCARPWVPSAGALERKETGTVGTRYAPLRNQRTSRLGLQGTRGKSVVRFESVFQLTEHLSHNYTLEETGKPESHQCNPAGNPVIRQNQRCLLKVFALPDKTHKSFLREREMKRSYIHLATCVLLFSCLLWLQLFYHLLESSSASVLSRHVRLALWKKALAASGFSYQSQGQKPQGMIRPSAHYGGSNRGLGGPRCSWSSLLANPFPFPVSFPVDFYISALDT